MVGRLNQIGCSARFDGTTEKVVWWAEEEKQHLGKTKRCLGNLLQHEDDAA